MGIVGGLLVGVTLVSLVATIWKLASRASPAPGPVARWELPGLLVLVLAFCIMDSGFAVEVKPFAIAFIGILALAQSEVLRATTIPAGTVGHGGYVASPRPRVSAPQQRFRFPIG